MFLIVVVQHLQLLFCHFCLLQIWETYTYSAYLVFTHNTHTHIYIFTNISTLIYIYIYIHNHSLHVCVNTHTHTPRDRERLFLTRTKSLWRHSAAITFIHRDMELYFLPADEMELYKSKLYTEKACYKFWFCSF